MLTKNIAKDNCIIYIIYIICVSIILPLGFNETKFIGVGQFGDRHGRAGYRKARGAVGVADVISIVEKEIEKVKEKLETCREYDKEKFKRHITQLLVEKSQLREAEKKILVKQLCISSSKYILHYPPLFSLLTNFFSNFLISLYKLLAPCSSYSA